MVSGQVGGLVAKNPAVESFVAMTGFSLLENLNRTAVGTYFVILKDWGERPTKELSAAGVLQSLGKAFYGISDARVMPFNPPAIQGLGTVGGFEFWIVNESDMPMEALEEVTQQFLEKASKRPELMFLRTAINTNCIQVFADLDRTKARALQVSIGDVYQTLQSLLGSVYVNNFNKYGHVFQVLVQASPDFRSSLEELGNIYVKSDTGAMVPLKELVIFRYSKGPNLISRFNGFPASQVNGGNAPGFSSGQAIKAMEEVAKEVLPLDMNYAWG